MDNAMMELALRRAGFGSLEEWREKTCGSAAVADMALMPYLVGYELYRVQAGDTLTKIAGLYGTTVESIETANPDVQLRRLEIGRILVVPLGFSVVPEDVPMSWGLMRYVIRGMEARYPALSERVIGQTEYGRSLYRLQVGTGPRRVYYNASHHANEWITTPAVLACLEWLLEGASRGKSCLGIPLEDLLHPQQLSRDFMRLVGTSPSAYLMDIRLDRAKQLLRDSALSNEEIAAHVGFGSTRRLYRALQNSDGVTPGQYRKQQRSALEDAESLVLF